MYEVGKKCHCNYGGENTDAAADGCCAEQIERKQTEAGTEVWPLC